MTPGGLATLGVFIGLGIVILSKLVSVGMTAVNSAGPPPAAVQGGAATAGDAVVEYFEDNPNACPRIALDDDLLERFPELPAVLAALKFTLSQQQWLDKPAIRGTTNIILNRPTFAQRVELVGLLNDPSFTIDHEVHDIKTAGFAAGPDRLVLTDLGAIDTSLKKGRDTPFGLAFNILHELTHVQQIRRGEVEGGATTVHSDPVKEGEANSFALHMPRSLFAGEAWERIRAANMCGSEKPTTGDPDDDTGTDSNISGSLILVFDASGSMSAELPSGERRIDVAKASVRQLLTGGQLPPTVEVGLIIYYDCSAIEWQPFTTDHQELLIHIEIAEPDGFTPLAAAIDEAVQRMASEAAASGQPGDIVVVSDGEETCGGDPYGAAARGRQQTTPPPGSTSDGDRNQRPRSGTSPRAVLTLPSRSEGSPGVPLRSSAPVIPVKPLLLQEGGGIRVSTIGFAVEAETEQQLSDIARQGGGTYIPAGDIDALSDALGEAVTVDAPAEDPPVPNVISTADLEEKSYSPWPWILAAVVAGLIAVGAAAIAVRQLQTVPIDELSLPCESCGRENPGGTRFCIACGQPLPVACPGCHTVSRAGAQFCRGCGRDLSV